MLLPYSLLLWLLLPYVLLRLLWRSGKQPEYLRHVGERFGFYPPRDKHPVIWLHAVSVGETRATQNLVARLLASYPQHQILLTHSTPTGRAASEQLYGDRVLKAYLPYDYAFAVRRFLRHFRPQLGLLMETELWFNLIEACHKGGIPLLLLNARMSEKSERGYARFSRLTGDALGKLAGVAAQTADDAARLARLGARNVSVMGNLKFDIEPPPAMLQKGRELRALFGSSRKIFLTASTRDGEEILLLDALRNLNDADFLLVIVPRHPQRFAAVAELLEQRRIPFIRRSELKTTAESAGSLLQRPLPSQTQAVLGDSMGEMFAYYAAADLAFIGGSLLPFGGQNLIEACAVGTPVLLGPHTHNFAEAARLAVQTGAAIQLDDAAALVGKARRLLHDNEKIKAMRRQCIEFVEANRGATDKALQLVDQQLAAAVTRPGSLPQVRSSR